MSVSYMEFVRLCEPNNMGLCLVLENYLYSELHPIYHATFMLIISLPSKLYFW